MLLRIVSSRLRWLSFSASVGPPTAYLLSAKTWERDGTVLHYTPQTLLPSGLTSYSRQERAHSQRAHSQRAHSQRGKPARQECKQHLQPHTTICYTAARGEPATIRGGSTAGWKRFLAE